MPLCWPLPSPYDTWQNAGSHLYPTWSGFVSWVWALHSSPCFCVWPEAKRIPSGGRRLSQTSGALLDPAPAAASEAQSLPLVGALVVFSGSLAADLEALVFGAHTPAVFETAVVFEALVAVLGGHTDAAFEDLAVDFEPHAVSFWVHTVVALEARAAEFGALDGTQALRIDAAGAAGVQRCGRAA